MKRRKKLLKLQNDIGGLNAKKVSDLQKMHGLQIGKDLTDKDLIEIFNDFADQKFDFPSFKTLIEYEQQLQHEFYSLKQQIIQNISANGHLSTLKRLRRELEETLDALEICYLTVNNTYNDFLKQAEDFYGKIQEQIEHKKALNG